MKQSLEDFIAAYRHQAGPICNDLWDADDTAYVTKRYNPPRDDEPNDSQSPPI